LSGKGKRTEMYKKEAPISPAGPEHSKTRSRNYIPNKFYFRGNPATGSKGLLMEVFLFCLKGFKTTFTRHLTFHSIPIKNNGERERKKRNLIF